MQKEYDCIIKNDTWALTDRPKNRKVVSSKCVFKRKISPDSKIVYKA